MNRQEFISLYRDLFAGRPDVYAIRTEWTETNKEGVERKRSAYLPSIYNGNKETTREKVGKIAGKIGAATYGDEAVAAHLYGAQFLGVYPLHADSTVKFFALDLDGDTPDEAWAEAQHQYQVLKHEAGLDVYMEVSQSGNGFHVWGFLEAPMDAGVVRRALKGFFNKSEYFDRAFPNQSRVTEHRPLGNLIALPLFKDRVLQGKNCFVDPETREPYASQPQFLTTIKRIPVALMEKLAAEAPELPEERETRVRGGQAEGNHPGVNKLLDPRFGCEWVRWHVEHPDEVTEPEWYALACNLAQMKGGREAFHHISSQDRARYSVTATDQKFNQAVERNAPYTYRYIHENMNGPESTIPERFPAVHCPYMLGKISLFDLMATVDGDASVSDASSGLDVACAWAEDVERDPMIGMGLPTGIVALDEHLGFRNATLNVLAARPSIGKTAFAMDIAYRAADSNIPVYFFSLEMSREQLWRRLLCRAAGVSASKMRKGGLDADDWARIRAALTDIKGRERFPLFVDDSTRDIRKIMEIAYRLKEEHGHGIVMIDYLGLLDWQPKENEYAGTTRNSKESKLTAKATDMPVLLLHQFNRQGDDMSVGAETSDSWLRSTGQIEQDADVILYLLGERGVGIKEREIVKQKDRDGEAGVRVLLEFNPYLMQFGAIGTWYTAGASMTVPADMSVEPGADAPGAETPSDGMAW